MTIAMKIGEINYGDIAVKAMPIMENSAQKFEGAVPKLIHAVSQLPEELVRSVFNAIPVAQKNEIVAAFVRENREKLVEKLDQLLASNSIGIILSDLSMNQDLDVTARIDYVDYPVIVERFLPVIKEKLLSMGGMATLMKPVIECASARQICDLLDRLLGDRKEGMVVSLVNKNQSSLISAIEKIANENNIRLSMEAIEIKT